MSAFSACEVRSQRVSAGGDIEEWWTHLFGAVDILLFADILEPQRGAADVQRLEAELGATRGNRLDDPDGRALVRFVVLDMYTIHKQSTYRVT